VMSLYSPRCIIQMRWNGTGGNASFFTSLLSTTATVLSAALLVGVGADAAARQCHIKRKEINVIVLQPCPPQTVNSSGGVCNLVKHRRQHERHTPLAPCSLS
jgi:hypothetical protein